MSEIRPPQLASRRAEAVRTAGEEGLILEAGIGSSGFKGVYKNPAARQGYSGDPGFCAVVNQGNNQALRLGNFFTPEEGALEYARHMRDRLAGGLANRAGPSTLMRRAESAGVEPDAPEALPASFWQQKPQCPAAPPGSARHGEPSGFAFAAGTKVWAKQGPQAWSWWPAVVVSVLPDAESVQVKWSAPLDKWDDGARIRLGDLRHFSSVHRHHSAWLKGTLFGTDFGKLKHPTLRTKLNKAIGAIDNLLEAINQLGVAAEVTVSPLGEVVWGGSCSDETGSVVESDESADPTESEARPPAPAARPSSSLQRVPAAYEEGAELGTTLVALGLLDQLQVAFGGVFDVWGGSSSDDLQYLRRRCGEDQGLGFLSQLGLGLGDAEVLAIQEYLVGSAADAASAPQSQLWDSGDTPWWR